MVKLFFARLSRTRPGILVAALFAAIVFSGWVSPATASSTSYLTPEGTARMMAADGIKAQWQTARQICSENGLATGTIEYRLCFVEYQVQSLRALRARAKALTEKVAQHHGLCIDRQKFEIARCTEI